MTQSTTPGGGAVLTDRGDVLLIPFPFSDLTGRKARPVVTLSSVRYHRSTGEVIVAMLTAQPRSGAFDCEVLHWQQAGLFLPTWARAKLATLTSRMILTRLGRLSRADLNSVDRIVRRALSAHRRTE